MSITNKIFNEMTYSPKLKYQLKQYTPLIHFQHDEAGATLRASEVKPKLDKIIINRLTNINGDDARNAFQEKYPNWLVGGGNAGHVALDYKMSFRATKENEYLLSSSIPKFTRKEYDDHNVLYLSGVPYFADNESIKKKNLNLSLIHISEPTRPY